MAGSTGIHLYYHPRACSLAAHLVLEELGVDYSRHLVDLRKGQNRDPEYLAVNPTGAIPALVIDGVTLTETHAILTYLGDLQPERNLLPRPGDFARYRAHEWMNFLSSSVHAYVRSIFRPSAYAGDNGEAEDAVKQQGVRNLAGAVGQVEQRLANQTWALGEQFSVVDAYLFVLYLWTTDRRIATVPARPNWDRVAERVWRRPAVRRVIEVEQEDRDYGVPDHWTLS